MSSGYALEILDKAKKKIAAYCAYQERCQKEVRDKLYSYGLKPSDVEDLIAWLITENFLNEERYAQTFAGGKFRVKQWGRLKITRALQQKDISSYCIKEGLKEIDQNDYLDTIRSLAEKKMREYQLKTTNSYQLKNKASQFLLSRGFEPDLVWDILKSLD